jgi:hypothetical protein
MKIEARGNSSLDKRFAHAVLAEDNQRYGALNARAAPGVFADGMVWGSNQRRLAHVSSNEIRMLISAAQKDE